MKCPFCENEETQVKDSRVYNEGFAIKRRRFCSNCNGKFSTIEEVVKKEIIVIKKNGTRELFDRYKLKNAIKIGCGKRASEEILNTVLTNITNSFEIMKESEISSKRIGDLVLEELRRIDKVAFIRFASVYKDFGTEHDFKDFIKQLED